MIGAGWNAAPADFDDAEILAEAAARAPIGRVIGLAGAAGSGKSAAAEILARHGFNRLRFSAPLKTALAALLTELGVPRARICRMIEGDLKETPVPELSHRTPRHAMQTLGTEWGRDQMDPDFWAGPMGQRAAEIAAAGGRVVFEDLRFANEAAAVRAAGGLVVKIEGRGVMLSGDHPSEAFAFDSDVVLDNSGSLDRLEGQILAHLFE